MYLDNILISKPADTNVSYSEILMDCIETSEAIYASEAFAISSEFAKRTLGSEAVSDWWPKIKAFFHKIWENLKRIITKMAAWMASLPVRIITLCKKIYTMWVKRGVEGRVKNLKTNLAKKIVHLDKDAAESFKQSDWGIQNPNIIEEAVDAAYKALDSDPKAAKFINEMTSNFGTTREKAKAFLSGLFGLSTFDTTIADSFVKHLADSYADVDKDAAFDPKEAFKESVMSIVQNAISDTMDRDRSKENEVSEAKIMEWFSCVKNNEIAKKYEKLSVRFTRVIEYLDRKHKNASKTFDTLYKNDDEDGIKALIAELKAMNKLTVGIIIADGFFAKLYASCALNIAKMLNEAIKCYVSGKDSDDNKPGKTNISNEKINSKESKQQKPNGKGKPVSNSNLSAADVEHRKEVDERIRQMEEDMQSVSKDPDFAAFLRM
jgi:hypothetical protein